VCNLGKSRLLNFDYIYAHFTEHTEYCQSNTPEMSFLSPDDFIVLVLLASTSDFFNVFNYRSASCAGL